MKISYPLAYNKELYDEVNAVLNTETGEMDLYVVPKEIIKYIPLEFKIVPDGVSFKTICGEKVMGKTFKHNQDNGDVSKAKFADRRKKKLRKIVSQQQNLEVKNEEATQEPKKFIPK